MAAWRDPRRVDFTLADGAVRGNAVPVAGLGGRSYIGARAGVEEVTFGAEAAIPQAPETPHEPEEPDEPAEPPAGGGDDDEPPAPPTVPPTAGAGWSVATPRPFTDFIGPDGDRAPDSSSEIVLKTAWTGPAFNPLTLEWVLTGGGHKDRSGNEILKALLGTGDWSLFKGNTYPAEPVGTHNYGGLVVHPDANVLSMQTGGGGYYEGESMKGPRPVFTIDLTTGAVRSHPGTETDHYGFAGYNPKTREVWGVSTSGGYIIGADGKARGVPVTGAANWCQFAGGMAYDPVTDAMYAIRADYENGLLKVTKTGSGLNVERIGGVPGSIAAHAGIAFRRDTGIGFIWGGGKAITTLDAASRQFGAIATPGVAVPAATNGAFHFHYSGRSDAFFGQPYDRVYRFQM
jgi:hypothetical protein